MTRSLEEAFARASKLPPEEQDTLAAWLLREIDSEGRWDALFAGSQAELSRLAADALAEHAEGGTRDLDPGRP